ncbi:hypothetical protein SS1G_10100 [Sclerotinia sclerotiorum 1980 UF-70]|uniref:Pathway-specific nitrogen regulator n=2 Tax=Sclerotinia sclerotiorum (strain ATCC 18683 / 1980 / Ss-1) TaxID=665079 RepID=A7EXN5_SCLS1|nr:hypothetical protein SS1G_10100 [Sclerotinia sclerotiorum 1980 UF-70]APA16000.1 hypothetical protein sscle_16g107700 [Sclerotinia sclerotiorum 1980 UF-70]EDN94227.1 hypothetical protein SS1G_10100 [Sclerotinia sclerotiorum 1980 UF-70]
MSQSSSRRQSDFKIHEDFNCTNDMVEDIDPKKVGGESASSKEKDIGEVMSQSKDPQRHAEERIEMEESEVEGDSILDQELSELQEDDSILDDAGTKHNEHDDCEDCKHAREEKRKRAIARGFQMRKIDAEIKAAAKKVVESIEKDDPERGRAANDHDDLILGTQKDGGYESEDHDDSLLSAQTDESYERNLYNGQHGTELTLDTTKATLEDDGETENEDSVLHHDLSSTDAETERGYLGGEDIKSRHSSSNYGDVDDDVFSNGSEESRRFSVNSADEAPNKISVSNRSSWQSNRQPDLSKEAQQLIELNSPIVGEEASTESVISRIPSGISRASAPKARDTSCSPRKVPRHPFRTPSDIRAMQIYSPASSLFSTPHSAKRQQNPTVSRLGTPAGSQYSKSRTPTRFKKNREESPLVLLHVTVLPLQWQYSKAIVAPELPANLYNIREAYYLLQEKLSETILTRGILLPHPQDSYECLEERFLDALELPVRPRAKILRCGHYIGPNTTSSDDDSADEKDSGFGSTGRFKNRPEKVWCDICRRDVRYEDDDQDEDGKKFNIKIFASNGLMRAGAWAAAWREMERVDVEIEPFVQPWMVEDMEDLIERLREAEERGRDDDYDQYSDDDSCGESLGSEAQRLHEQDLAKVTLRPKRGDVESRNAREDWLAAASKAAEEEADRIAREDEALRQEEEARVEEEEVRQLEEEASRLHKEEEEAQKFANLDSESSNVNEDQTVEGLEAEAQQLHEEDMAAIQALEEEAERIHEAEVAEQKALEEEAQRIFEAELAEQKEVEEEARRILKEEEVRRRTKEEESKQKIEEQEKSTDEARINDISNKASTRNKDLSSTPITRTSPGDESLSELLVKAARVVMRDRKNVLILLLSVAVLFLALKPNQPNGMAMPKYASDIIIQNHRYEAGQSVDQRGYEQMRQVAADGTLRMREIESSMGWKGQDVVITSSMKTQTPDVVQAEISIERQKQVVMEIDAPDVGPVVEKMEEASQIATFETSENVEAVAGTLSMSGDDIDVTSKDIPSFETSSNPSQNNEKLPMGGSESQSKKLDTDLKTDTQM